MMRCSSLVPPRRMDYQAPGGQMVDVVGGVGESSDFLAKNRFLPPLERGDLLAILTEVDAPGAPS